MNRYKKHGGWYGESHRHYLAAKGIKTAKNYMARPMPSKEELEAYEASFNKRHAEKLLEELNKEIDELIRRGETKWPDAITYGDEMDMYEWQKEELNDYLKMGMYETMSWEDYYYDEATDKEYMAKKEYYAYIPTYVAADLPLIAGDAVGTAGASVVSLAPLAGPLAFAGVALWGASKLKKKKEKTGTFFAEKDGSWSYYGNQEYMADKQMKPGKLKTVNGIPITAEKLEDGKIYPIGPEDVAKALKNMPKDHLKGLKEVRFKEPNGEQGKAWAQYVRGKRTIYIFAQPKGKNKIDGKNPEQVRKIINDYVLPHEVGHHRALYHKRITDRSLAMAEARADANVIGLDPDDRDVKLLKHNKV